MVLVRAGRTARYGSWMKPAAKCPTCKGNRKPAKDNPSFPFCSGRCKLADLSNWLEGRYSLAGEPVDPELSAELGNDQRWN